MAPRLLLYNPRAPWFTLPLGPLAVGTAAAAALPIEVELLDGRMEEGSHAELVSRRAPPLAVGISALSGPPLGDALLFAAAVRARWPEVPIIWGGWHASILPEQVAAHRLADAAVIGQGEATLVELLQRLLDGASLDGVPGSCTVVHGRAQRHPARALENPDRFPPMNYDLVDLERYFARSGVRRLDYTSSQGCPYRCAFCSDPLVYGRSWKGIPAERVVEELSARIARHRLTDIAFQDDLFFVNRRRANAIMEGLVAHPGVTWTATARAAQIARMKEEELSLLRDSGCRRLTVGAESGSLATLERLSKDQQAGWLVTAAERLARLGIAASFSFIAGSPGEGEADLAETFALIRQLKRIHPGIDAPMFLFTPYPGNPLTDSLPDDVVPQTLEEWSRCDFYGSRATSLSPATQRRVRVFNFYARHAGRPQGGRVAHRALHQLARVRLQRDVLGAPWEWLASRLWGRVRGVAPRP